MSKNSGNTDYQSLMKKALLELREMKSKLSTLERAKTEPIAIIGMGCRFPGGADHPEAFWQILRDELDTITEVPKNRWDVDAYYDPDPDSLGKMYTRHGGFVNQLYEFDAHFFGIPPREAISLDPQQRLLLEVSWESLENAGLSPERLAGSQTGVFIGICSNDYSQKLLTRDITEIDAYMGTGNAHSVASGRLSYILGLKGPSLAVDTACSSSLVAVHLACQSLRNGECSLALVGGVNRLLSPEFTINFSKAHMLATDGRCKTFDAAADGYVRAEGCGVVILKRLSDALADGDNILAQIRGSAINQDGRSSGLTVPNGPSQQAVIRQALQNGGVEANQVEYIEAHGTGTSLGDPIEIGALEAVFGKIRTQEYPLIVGSVKTNIGHLEGAAGIASLIKVVLALQHEEIPRHLHFQKPNPHINWESMPIVVPTQRTAWRKGTRQRLAGVSSFGFSGTNAHVVVEEAPTVTSEVSEVERPQHLLTLSAKNESALRELAQRYQEFIAKYPETSLADIGFTANKGRSHFDHRLAIVATSHQQLQEALNAVTQGKEISGLVTSQIKTKKRPKIAFLFTGQGSQYLGMGQQLYNTQPTFRDALDHCDEILRPYWGEALIKVLYPEPGTTSPLDQTFYTQPALFALEYAIFQLWKSWGIEPTVVMGHSLGEYVAACVAGVFSLEDGLKLVVERARLMQSLPPTGEMVAVLATKAVIESITVIDEQQVAIAAYNGANNTVISGERQAVQSICSALEAQGIITKKLQTSHAFHSPLMEPILAQFQILAASITYNPPQIEIISNLTAQPLTAAAINADYWCRHLRAPVQFAASLETLAAVGYQFFVEIGPKPVLLGMGRHCLPEVEAVWLPSLRPGYDDWQQMLLSLAQLYVHGVSVDWSGFDQNYPRQLVSLPTYPFQRQRYWLDTLNTGHQSKTLSSPEQLETSTVVNLLLQGNIQQLVRQLEAVEDISADEIKLLPKLMEKLVQQHQLTTVSITDKNKASTLIEESSSNSIFIPKIVEIFQYEQLLKSDPGEQKQLLKTYFSQLLAKVAGISQDQLDWQQPLANLGLDSLMIADMRKHMESNLKIIVPVEYFAALSLEEILKQLLLLITGKSIPKQVDSNPEYLLQANIWLPRLQTNSQASFRLFCFPYAGAGASIFYSWIKDLPPEIELCPIQLPGRENRTGESPFTRIKPLIKTLASLLHPHLDIPFAFFGHSLGALLSFELARELRRLNFPAPSYLFVSGSRAPQIPDLDSPIHTLPEPQFKEALQRLNGTPEIILKDSNLMQLFLPALRSDFAMLETYFYTNEKPLECPIFGFGGLNDRRVSSEEIDAWHEQTQSYFKLQMFSDDHFFLHSAQSAMVQTISHEIQKTLILKT